jgi:transcriptional regulator with XRE-family HTH domain
MATSWKNINHKFSKERHAEIKQEAKAELKRIGFDKLRLARKQTQVALAERLDVPQNAVSRLERRTDLLLSTLRGYVEGLGGKLELRAVFPDGDFLLESLGPPRSRRKQPARRAAKSRTAA